MRRHTRCDRASRPQATTHEEKALCLDSQPSIRAKGESDSYDCDTLLKSSQVELIFPEEIYEIIEKDLWTEHSSPTYCQVILPLLSLVEGVFFTEYIKKGTSEISRFT